MINKKFTNLQTDQVVTINEVFSDIAILDNGDRIAVQRLLDTKYFEEYIDPSSFFNNNNSFNILAEKIKSIPDEVLQKLPERDSPRIDSYDVSQESAIIQADPEEEKRILMEKARQMTADNVVNSLQKQNEMFSEFLEDDEDGFIVTRPEPKEVQQPVQSFNQQPIATQVKNFQAPEPVRIEVEDPIITMFRGVKRKEEFSVDIKIEDIIPRLDFIEMLEDSYELSIIDFLSNEFTNKLLSDPEKIKKIIGSKIREMVYGLQKEQPKEVEDNTSQSITTEKKTPTRKPKPNTAIGEKPNTRSPRKKQQPQKND